MRTSAIAIRRLGILAILILIAPAPVGLLGAPSARALPGPTGSAQATIELSLALRRALRKDGVKVRAIAPAAFSGPDITFPGGGSIDPLTGQMDVDYEGGLLLQRRGRMIRMVSLQLDSAAGTLDGDLGYGELTLAGAACAPTPEGFGDHCGPGSLNLTPTASRTLRAELRLPARRRHHRSPRRRAGRKRHRGRKALLVPALRSGQSLGVLTASAQPVSVGILPGGTTTLTLDPGLRARLADLDVDTSTEGVSGEPSPGTYTLAVTSGALTVGDGALTVTTAGALQLTQTLHSSEGSTSESTLTLASPSLDLAAGSFAAELSGSSDPPGPLNLGSLGRNQLGATAVPAGEPEVDPAARSIALPEAVPVTLTPVAAEVLDGFRRLYEREREEAKAQDQFKTGEPLGTVSFSAQAE